MVKIRRKNSEEISRMDQGYALTYAKNYLKTNKNQIIVKLNKKINLPVLSEKQEGELLEAVYDVVLEVFDDSEDSSK